MTPPMMFPNMIPISGTKTASFTLILWTKNTNSSVIFSDLITEDRIDITVESDVYDIVLYSNTNENIKIKINIAFVNGKYYAYGNNLTGFAITNEFESLLIENGFIKKWFGQTGDGSVPGNQVNQNNK